MQLLQERFEAVILSLFSVEGRCHLFAGLLSYPSSVNLSLLKDSVARYIASLYNIRNLIFMRSHANLILSVDSQIKFA